MDRSTPRVLSIEDFMNKKERKKIKEEEALKYIEMLLKRHKCGLMTSDIKSSELSVG